MVEGTQIGAYVIERQLGRGGFGVVYIGRDTRLGRRVAIKQLLPELSHRREIVERFFNEARAAAAIDHPGIVEIYEVGWHSDGSAYFAMKLLEGDSLAKRLAHGPLPIAVAAAIARQVASALAAAHARGIVHRDLKPDNVILVPDEEVAIGARATVLDFGIAKLVGDQPVSMRTATGMIVGTPFYMSPEQCRGAGEVDHRTDVYALGCILFEMLAGRPPFVGAGAGEVLGMHQFVETPTPRAFRADLPPDLEALVMRMLAKRADERPQQMADVAAALQPFTGARPTGETGTPSAPLSIAIPKAAGTGGGHAAGSAGALPHTSAPPGSHAGAAGAAPTPQAAPTERSRSAVPTAPDRAADRAAPITTLGSSSAEAIAVATPRRSRALVFALAGVAVAAAATVAIVVGSRSSSTSDDRVAVARDAAASELADAAVAIDIAALSTDAVALPVLDAEVMPTAIDAAIAIDAGVTVDAAPHKPDRAAQIKAVVKLLEAVAADCTAYEERARGAEARYGKAIVDAARAQVPCTPATPTCDGSDERAGNDAFSAGQYAAALAKYEAALRCTPNAKRVVGKAFLAACRAKNVATAKSLYARLGPRQQNLVQVCLQQNIDPRPAGAGN